MQSEIFSIYFHSLSNWLSLEDWRLLAYCHIRKYLYVNVYILSHVVDLPTSQLRDHVYSNGECQVSIALLQIAELKLFSTPKACNMPVLEGIGHVVCQLKCATMG